MKPARPPFYAGASGETITISGDRYVQITLRQMTISDDAGTVLSVVASIPYASRNSRIRSSRGPDARTCAGAKSFPRNKPRIMASAMLPAPMKPMVRSLVNLLFAPE